MHLGKGGWRGKPRSASGGGGEFSQGETSVGKKGMFTNGGFAARIRMVMANLVLVFDHLTN